MAEPTELYRRIEEALGEPFPSFIESLRPHTSWRDIALKIRRRTDITVGHEILRRWFLDRIEVKVTVR